MPSRIISRLFASLAAVFPAVAAFAADDSAPGEPVQSVQAGAQDKAENIEAIRQAAEQGDLAAQKRLVEYYGDYGENRNLIEAVKWIRKAADQGDAKMQNNLGCYYMKGIGVKKDAAEAVKWFRKAAEQGHVEAQFNLSLCYYKGDGVKKDAAEAVKWIRKAADQGDPSAMYRLGYCGAPRKLDSLTRCKTALY